MSDAEEHRKRLKDAEDALGPAWRQGAKFTPEAILHIPQSVVDWLKEHGEMDPEDDRTAEEVLRDIKGHTQEIDDE